jgi:hypothetical protein
MWPQINGALHPLPVPNAEEEDQAFGLAEKGLGEEVTRMSTV